MPIDVEKALAAELDPVEFSWTSSDVQLYHLGLGAGADPMDQRELRYLVDDTPQVLPTFGNVAQSFHMTEPPSVKLPGIDIELSRVLHASEAVSVPAPIPPSGTGIALTRFTDIWDKGKAAVIWSETTVIAPDGTPLRTKKRSIVAHGEGGFGGERGPSTSAPPEHAPDFELSIPVRRSRRCCTGCAGTVIRCIRILISLRQRVSRPILHGAVHLRHDVQGHGVTHAARRRQRAALRLLARGSRRGVPRRDAGPASGKEGDKPRRRPSRHPAVKTPWCCPVSS
jgi:hypothetical protein